MSNIKVDQTNFTEQEHQEKAKFISYFNVVMFDLLLEASMDTQKWKKVRELIKLGSFHITIPEMEELIKKAKEVVKKN